MADTIGPRAGWVNDGPGPDLGFQNSVTSISANWGAFTDPESGIAFYDWAIGTVPGDQDVQAWTGAGTDTSATNSGLTLQWGGMYYVSVRATDRAGNRGAAATSNGIMTAADTAAPTPGTVNDGLGADIDQQATASSLSANWTGFNDVGTGIAAYELAIGTTAGGTNVQGWTNVGPQTSATVNSLTLAWNTRYFVSVRAIDHVNNIGAHASSDGVTPTDNSAPVAGAVRDGPGADVDVQATNATIIANWSGFSDPQSGIASYQWAIGIAAGSTSILAWTSVGAQTTATRNGLSLAWGTRYYVSVRAINGAGTTGASASSNGVVPQDTQGPTPGIVNDGTGPDIDYQSSTTTLSANWSGFVDAGSGIASYEWSIGTSPGGVNVQGWANVGSQTTATNSTLTLSDTVTYYVSVRATDRANNRGGVATSDGISVSQYQTTVSQFGITWTFDTPTRVGQFANGDWWVIGPVRITGISPASTASGGRTINGSQINPDPLTQNHGYDSTASAGTFVPGLNRALGVSAANPLTLQTDQSLISSISVAAGGARPQLDVAAILTCLGQVPAAGSFRPPYCGSDKTIRFNKSQLNYSMLRSLSPAAGAPSLASVERQFERPWLDHIPGWSGRFFHPAQNMPDYGREMSVAVGVGALVLHLNFTNAQKETLLIRYVQLGIDLYGIVEAGALESWEPDGGHASGRKWPILFAGMVLGHAGMASIGNQNVAFGEDGQTFVVAETSPGVFNRGYGGYTSADRGLPEWGIRHSTYPNMDNRAWTADYRQCCTANAWAGFVLAARIMGARSMWNHDALFDYQDRYMTIENAWRQWDGFTEAMWDAYRPSY